MIRGRSFEIVAEIDMPSGGGNGPLVAQGKFGGWSFYLKDGKPAAHMALTQQASHQWDVAAATPIPVGPAKISYAFDYDGGGFGRGGLMRISVNGSEVARGRIERTFLIPAGLGETFDIGDDTGATVVDYPNGHSFSGEIRKIEVFLK